MYDNLTADDIITIWSESVLDEAIAGHAPGTSLLRLHARLAIENQRKRPFALLQYGVRARRRPPRPRSGGVWAGLTPSW